MKNYKKISRFFAVGVKDFQFSSELRSFLRQYPVGALALFNSPWNTPKNIWKDLNCLDTVYEFLKKSLKHVSFLTVDQEGGCVRRLRGPFINLPSAQKMSTFYQETQDLVTIQKLYQLSAKQLKLAGIGLNLAPVCDMRTAKSHLIIGDRSFGETIENILPLVELFCKTFEKEGVRTTLKHAPGHGPTQQDSHEQIAVLFKEKEKLLEEDFQVFKKSAPWASAIMTAHVAYPDRPETIVSLDKACIEELRQPLPSHLFWITDDLLAMKAVQGKKPWLQAWEAEYDFILLCGKLDDAARAIEETIHYVEKKPRDFTWELSLETRLKRIQSWIPPPSFPKFSEWSSQILELEKKSREPLYRIQQKTS